MWRGRRLRRLPSVRARVPARVSRYGARSDRPRVRRQRARARAGVRLSVASTFAASIVKGDAKILELLNEVLTGELTSTNQYFLHAKMCRHWGYSVQAAGDLE